MNRRDEIRARLDAATPGPWEWGGGNIIYTPQPIEVSEANWGGKGLNSYRLATAGDEGAWRDEDAALIAHAPADLRDLLAVADAARLVSAALAEFGAYYVVDGRSVRHELDDALARLDAVTGGEHQRPNQSATKIHPLGGER